ncbi:MAG TPA: hypothetical protein VG675_05220 [Bryobacteraceae bacterium]|nr:hypothetical protein [Bryobacteraceae bacterium]
MKAAALLALVLPALPGQVAMQPFQIDHFLRQDSAADVSFLLDAPAGKHGFVRSVNGHLATDAGRIRFWGVNLTGFVRGSTNLPPKEDAALWAAELGRLGINCVRFHFLDHTTTQNPRGLIDGTRNDTRVFDKDQVDRLDYFIYQLKNRGIYSDLNLNVGRTYKPGDEVPDSNLIGVAKAMTYIGPRLLELQREYARMLLTHYNPYTKSKYSDEPAIAIVELVNENSVFEFWLRNWLRGDLKPGSPRYQLDFTPYYEKLLTDRYNEWLKKRFTPPELARFRKLAGAKPGEPVRRLRREEFVGAPKERFYTEAAFYTDVEGGFFREMKSYLKNTLGVKSLITGTADHTYFIPGMPQLRSTSSIMDIIDAHVYWQHPAIYGERNTPMVNDPLHATVVKLTRSAFVGKPLVVTEVNHPQPNEYLSEMIPILASYGAFQDWDGIFFYTFEPKLRGQWQPLLADPFDISEDPVRIAQLPAGALLFLRDIKPATRVVERHYSTDQINESLRLPESEMPYFTPGFPLSIPLRHESRIRCLDCPATPMPTDDLKGPYISDTRELSWYAPDGKDGLVTIDTDRSQALVGFVRDEHKMTRYLSADIKNDFCAITLSSLDGKPVPRSTRMLLTATSREQNTGSQWNDRHTLWKVLGKAPTEIETVTGWLMLRNIEGAVAINVTALDGSARPIGQPQHARRLEAGWEFAVGDTPTTSYLIEPIR